MELEKYATGGECQNENKKISETIYISVCNSSTDRSFPCHFKGRGRKINRKNSYGNYTYDGKRLESWKYF